jgi:uncharacterized protein (TIGR02996 family)
MRTFTFSDAKSHKFWNIELSGKSFTVTYGRMGTAGQTQTKKFTTEAKAKTEHDKLVAEKLKKGYTETTPAATPAAAPAAAPAAVAAAAPVAATPAPAAPPSGLRKFTFSDAASHKFWNIELTGKSFTVNYGRVGSAGQTQTKKFTTEAKAKTEADKLIAEKVKKGYVEEKAAAAAGGAALPSGDLRGALEAAIVENPDDLMAHQAYADHLHEIGDPRGEFIQVQLALEDEGKSTAERKKLQKKEADLLKKHGRAWLGDLARFLIDQEGREEYYPEHTFAFRRGWLDTVFAAGFGVNFSRCLAAATEQTRLLRQLHLQQPKSADDDAFEPGPDVPEEVDLTAALYPLARAHNLGNVRVFRLGDKDVHESCHTYGEAVAGIIKQMPKLEELHLLAHHVDTDQLFGLKTLHTLRVLMVFHEKKYPFAKLGKNPSLGNLTHLLCQPHALEPDDEEPYIRLAGLREVVRSPHLKSLTHLMLHASDFGDKGVDEIIKSGILKRLKMLDLRGGTITDKGAKALAKCADLKNLESLVLSRNCLTDEGIKALKATGVKLEADTMWQASDGGEVFDGMAEYLYEGDIE